jgi:hypothetical protein
VIPPALSAAFCFQDVFWLDHLTTYSNRTVICGKSLFFFHYHFYWMERGKHMKKSRLGFVHLVLVLFCIFLISQIAFAKVITIKAASPYPTNHYLTTDAFQLYGNEIEKRTHGKVKFKWFHAATIAPWPQSYDAVANGLCDFGVGATVFVVNRPDMDRETVDLAAGDCRVPDNVLEVGWFVFEPDIHIICNKLNPRDVRQVFQIGESFSQGHRMSSRFGCC